MYYMILYCQVRQRLKNRTGSQNSNSEFVTLYPNMIALVAPLNEFKALCDASDPSTMTSIVTKVCSCRLMFFFL